MHEFVSFNGKILTAREAEICAASQAALYARGVFTTVLIANQQPFLWQSHWQRLRAHAARIGLAAQNLKEVDVFQSLDELIVVNEIENGRARISLFDARGGALWKFESERQTEIFITTAAPRETPKKLKLTFSPFLVNSTSPLAGVKSCNYLENLLAFERAKSDGFDEAVRLNERGEIASACLANVFWTKNEKLLTPALAAGALAGTTREFVLNAARALGIECFEVAARKGEILAADAVFLTSAGIGVVKAAAIDRHLYDLNRPPEIAARLIEAFEQSQLRNRGGGSIPPPV
jgi:branched-subunit amino acid aminotransferase/4-amino-4-deoxychorismate lyase